MAHDHVMTMQRDQWTPTRAYELARARGLCIVTVGDAVLHVRHGRLELALEELGAVGHLQEPHRVRSHDTILIVASDQQNEALIPFRTGWTRSPDERPTATAMPSRPCIVTRDELDNGL